MVGKHSAALTLCGLQRSESLTGSAQVRWRVVNCGSYGVPTVRALQHWQRAGCSTCWLEGREPQQSMMPCTVGPCTLTLPYLASLAPAQHRRRVIILAAKAGWPMPEFPLPSHVFVSGAHLIQPPMQCL